MYSAPNLLVLAALLPLASAVVLLALGPRLARAAAYVATGALVAALGLSLATLILWVASPQFKQPRYAEARNFRWLAVSDPPQMQTPADLNPLEDVLARSLESQRRTQGLQIGVLVDALTIAMFLTISMIATFVHIFSIAFMGSDPRYHRFLAYLDLFCFAMFGLVLSNNLLQMLAFLQLVGVGSWLLIGFARQRRAPVRAANRAFLLHTLGTIAFAVGAGTLAAQSAIGLSGLTFFRAGADLVGTPVLEHQVIVAAAGVVPPYCSSAPLLLGLSWLTWAGFCLFIGAMVLSAQFPLHVWLAEAAEAPTPVLALLGSVGSVAAGAFVVARLYGIFTLEARLLMAMIGCLSCAAGALLALVQGNMKRVLCCSTISHLGLVMLFFGVGAYVPALFVLFVHAFCKSCLFLASGSVLQACHGETQFRRMGGLWRTLPITAAAFLLAMLSLCGTPWFSGFFGQEMGLATVRRYAGALPGPYGPLLWWIPQSAVFAVALGLWRCWWLIFGGRPRDPELRDSARENPSATLVLILLTGLVLVAPYLDIDHIVAKSTPPIAMAVPAPPHPDPLEAAGKLSGWASAWAALCIGLLYAPGLNLADRLRRLPVLNILYLWLREDFFLNYLYEGVCVRGFTLLAAFCTRLERYLISTPATLLPRAARVVAGAVSELDARLFDQPVRRAAQGVLFLSRLGRRPKSSPPVTEPL